MELGVDGRSLLIRRQRLPCVLGRCYGFGRRWRRVQSVLGSRRGWTDATCWKQSAACLALGIAALVERGCDWRRRWGGPAWFEHAQCRPRRRWSDRRRQLQPGSAVTAAIARNDVRGGRIGLAPSR